MLWRDSGHASRTRQSEKQGHKAEREPLEECEGKTRASASANRIHAVLKAILNHALPDKRVPDGSARRRAKPFGNMGLPRIRILTESEAVR